MDEQFDLAEKKVLVELVRLAQKQGMKGSKGDWKEFLDVYDKKFGAKLSDPTRRSNDVLASFLKSFTKEDDLKFFAKIMQCHLKRNIVEQITKKCADNESPEQSLVRLTLEHPHYPLEYSFPSNDEEWVVTELSKRSKKKRSNSMLAVDCEMVLCEDGTEALVRVCVVDNSLQVKLDEIVNPNKPIADYRTDITGISERDLGVTCSLADVQKSMKKLLSNGTILVGHSLNKDLQALKLDHARVIDTSLIFQYSDGPIYRRPSLNGLCKSVLGYEVRKNGAPHNCLDDARTAMKLVLAKIERGVDIAIPLVQEDVPKSEMVKLLFHRIPKTVRSEELYKVIPGDYTIKLKEPSRKAQGETYSALAIFKNSQEAHQAYENAKGSQEQDSSGKPQKLLKLKLRSGVIASLYVRKMANDDSLAQISTKRAFQAEETPGASKKLKTDQKIEEETSNQCSNHLEEIERLKEELSKRKIADSNQCYDHLKEIERLKQELGKKKFEITTLNKMISNLKRSNS